MRNANIVTHWAIGNEVPVGWQHVHSWDPLFLCSSWDIYWGGSHCDAFFWLTINIHSCAMFAYFNSISLLFYILWDLSVSFCQIDYNLYGMGHMHLSKMKFCHPVPDTFSPRKSNHIGLHKQHMDKLTCMPTDFPVIFSSLFCDKCFWDERKCLSTIIMW